MRGTEESEVELMIPRIVGNKNVTLIDLLEAGGASTEMDDQQKVTNNSTPARSMKMVPFRVTKWHAVFGFQVLLCVWLLLLTFRSPPPPPAVVLQDSTSSMISLAKLPDGRTSLDVDADVIRMVKPVVYQLDGVIRNGARAWSNPALNVYVGDSLSWTWTTNENVVECTKDGLIRAKNDRYIDSGELKSGGTYIKEFTVPNAYYFCSENSQTLSGKVVVFEQPAISIKREHFIGPFMVVPSGVKNDLTAQDLDIMDGCWKSCYTKNTELIHDFNYDTVVAECTGDYIFIGVAASAAPDKYTIGAFGRKAVVFSNAMVIGSSTSLSSVTTTMENGAYWFHINTQHLWYQTVGFAPIAKLATDSSNLVTCYNLAQCSQCLSYGFTSGSYIGCSSTVEKTAGYKRVFMTNTCPLTMPPGSV